MASPELSARLRYLHDSAHFLATTAPETSRHLMERHNALIFDNQIECEVKQKSLSCGACGTLIISGWEGTLESKSGRRALKRGKTSEDRLRLPRTMVYECGTCGKKTREQVKAPTPVKRSSAGVLKTGGEQDKVTTPTTNTSSASSSSKKRAKTRKGGLAAILALKRTADASGSGFDLMDFMKKV